MVRYFQLGPGKDGLQALLDYIDMHPDRTTWDPAVDAFWEEMARSPPEGVDATDPKHPIWSPEAAMSRGRWHPDPTLAEGQAVFWRYSVEITTALMHFSLAAGFTSPRLVNVLKQTGYLTSKQRDVTWRRLLETLQVRAYAALRVSRSLMPRTVRAGRYDRPRACLQQGLAFSCSCPPAAFAGTAAHHGRTRPPWHVQRGRRWRCVPSLRCRARG